MCTVLLRTEGSFLTFDLWVLSNKILYILEMGYGWEPAYLRSYETNTVRKGQKTFSNSAPYWIQGADNSGNMEKSENTMIII